MKLPHFTIRHLMIAVAISALSLYGWTTWLKRRDYLSRADKEAATCSMLRYSYTKMSSLRARFMVAQSEVEELTLRLEYHRHLAEKYKEAARYPWLPVAPDPPTREWQAAAHVR